MNYLLKISPGLILGILINAIIAWFGSITIIAGRETLPLSGWWSVGGDAAGTALLLIPIAGYLTYYFSAAHYGAVKNLTSTVSLKNHKKFEHVPHKLIWIRMLQIAIVSLIIGLLFEIGLTITVQMPADMFRITKVIYSCVMGAFIYVNIHLYLKSHT